jgi:hypothetical protein
MLYERGKGRLRSALDLPTVADERPLRRKKSSPQTE